MASFPEIEVTAVPEYDGEGNLEVYADRFVLFSSKQTGRYPEDGELVKLLKQ